MTKYADVRKRFGRAGLMVSLALSLAVGLPVLSAKKGGGKPPSNDGEDIPVKVTVCPEAELRTDLGIPAGYCTGAGITDDGGGPYVDGADGVRAFLNGPGSLIMNPVQKGNGAPLTDQRVISFDLGSPIEISGPTPNSATNVRFREATTFCGISELSLGASETACHLNFRFLETGGEEIVDEWYLRFIDDGAGTGGATATCIAEDTTIGCTAWTLETNEDHEAVLLFAQQRNKLTEVGRFTIPAKLIIERLP